MPLPEPPIRLLLRAARVAIVALGFVCAGGDAESATFTVTSAGDPGAGSLSAAIQAANANPGPDEIKFAIAGGGLHTIKPQNPSGAESFTTITDVVTIDGYSQSGSSPNSNGPGLGSNAVIQIELKFDDTLGLPGQPGLNFGTGSNGSLVKGLRITNFRHGIILQDRNITVAGNEILCDANGSVLAGILVTDDDNQIGGQTPAARNVIAIVGASGIETGATGNVIEGNFIGTNAAGTAAAGQQVYGVRLQGPGNTIGGVVPAARNVISGSGAGIRSEEGHSLIQGNYIGTDVTGTLAIPNAAGGVFIGGSNDIVNENLISGNLGPGIASLVGEGEGAAGPSDASIYGNRIGTDAAGTAPLPNTIGILLQGSANVVGGTTASLPNLIAFNSSDGVRIDGSASAATGNTIRGNSIHSNGGKAIANVSGGNTQLAPPAVTGTSPVSGTACASCVVDVYSDAGDEGRIHEGSTTANGLGDFTYGPAVTGPFVHATATDGSGNTSEMFVPTADLSLTLGADILHPELNESVLLMVTVTNGGPTATTGIAASIPIPAGLSHVSNDGGGSYVPGTGVWTVGSLTSGASAVLKITTQFTGPTSATVVAQVSASDVSDPDSTPNNGNALEDDQKSLQLVLVGAEILVNETGTVVNGTDGKCTLIEAITAANTDTPSGGVAGECVGGGGADTIRLQAASTYTLTAVDNTLGGFGNGLPQITSSITIEGENAVIERSLVGAPPFRPIAVTAAGHLTLKDVTVRFGNLSNAASACGGGIFNAGTLSLLRATVATNSIGDVPVVTEVAGGGICNTGTLDLVDSTVIGNAVFGYLGSLGGGIYSSGATTMTNSTVASNGVRVDPLAGSLPVANGGGILVQNGSLTAVDSEIADNRSTANGVAFAEGGGLGAINGATVSLVRTTVSGNESKLVGVGFNPAFSIGGGMAVFSAATVTLTDSTIGGATDADGNTTFGTGGGIALGPTAQLTMTGGTIAKNRANGAANIAGGGGGLANGSGVEPGGGSVTLTNVAVTGNQSTGGDGGGIFNRGALTMNGGELRANVAIGSGGGLANGTPLFFTGGNATLTGVTIAENTAAFFGGGAANSTAPGAATFAILTLFGATVENNQSTGVGGFGDGGGLMSDSNSTMAVLSGSIVRNNTAAQNGGGIRNGGLLTVDASTVADNAAVNGAGISQAGGFAGIRNGAVVSGNDATTVGGGVTATGGVVDVADATIRDNTAPMAVTSGGGGLVAFGAVMHVARSTITGNVAYGGAGILVGPNLGVSAAVDIDRSTLSGNQGVLSTALGITGSNATATRLTNSTISGNVVTGPGIIPGFTVNAGSELFVNNTTIVDNVGGGIINGKKVTLLNSIVAGNRQPDATPVDCETVTVVGATWTPGFTLTGRSTGCPVGGQARFIEPGELFTSAIGPLADNGGPTKTHAILPGSAAVDGGVPAGSVPAFINCAAVDQRGNPRPVDGDGNGDVRCDIGAVESQAPLPPAPAITSLTPASGPAGGAGFTLTVTGTAFQPTSEVRWNGVARATAFGDATSLTATIPASDLVSAVDLATVRVQVVTPGGGSSLAIPFTITSAKVDTVESKIVSHVSSGTVATPPSAPDRAGVIATITNGGIVTNAPVTVTVATYDGNPTSGTLFDAAGFVDLQVTGADQFDLLAARFYYPSTTTGKPETDLQLLYYTGVVWAPVFGPFGSAPVKNTTDDLDGTVSGGRFAVSFNDTSTPKLTELAGTVFAMAPLDTCRGLAPTIVGGPGNDKLAGTPGDDVILDLSGNNTVKGKGGNDTICLGDGADKVTTGAGNDWVDAGGGKNKVKSGAGNDTVTTGDGDDAIDTGKGDDAVVAGDGKNTIKTGSENDAIIAGSGDDKIDAGAGDDTVDAGEGKNTVKTGAGADQITTGHGDDKIDAGKDADTVDAGDGTNSVKTGPGDDQITTGSGNDKIDAGKDTDTCVAGGGTNTLKHCEQ